VLKVNPATVALAVALLGLAVAAGSSYSLVVNGQVSKEQAIVVSGKTYVPLSVLKSLGVASSLKGTTLTLGSQGGTPSSSTAAGGANAREALEGCVGETLFNGVWRLKVLKLEPISRGENQPGWGVTVELRNGTKVKLAPYRTGLEGISLVLPDGNALEFDELNGQALTLNDLAQAAGITAQLKFYFPYGTPTENLPKPEKLVVQFDPGKLWDGVRKEGVAFTTPSPSFRVRLDCQK
jgi:hypothetical protein